MQCPTYLNKNLFDPYISPVVKELRYRKENDRITLQITFQLPNNMMEFASLVGLKPTDV
jgi:hypothetical protein